MTEIISPGVYPSMKVIFINFNLCTFVIHTAGFIKVFSFYYSMDFVPLVFLFQASFLLMCVYVCVCVFLCAHVFMHIFSLPVQNLVFISEKKTYMCFRVWLISLKMMIFSYCMCSYSKVNFVLFFLIKSFFFHFTSHFYINHSFSSLPSSCSFLHLPPPPKLLATPQKGQDFPCDLNKVWHVKLSEYLPPFI